MPPAEYRLRIEHMDPTVTKLGQIFGLENDVPAVVLPSAPSRSRIAFTL